MQNLSDEALAEIFEDYEAPLPAVDWVGDDPECFETEYDYYRYMQEDCFCGCN